MTVNVRKTRATIAKTEAASVQFFQLVLFSFLNSLEKFSDNLFRKFSLGSAGSFKVRTRRTVRINSLNSEESVLYSFSSGFSSAFNLSIKSDNRLISFMD